MISPANLEENFHRAINDWIDYCKNPDVQINDFSKLVRDCDAYRKIVSMGESILPLLEQAKYLDLAFYQRHRRRNGNNRELAFSIVKRHGLGLAEKEILDNKLNNT